MVENRLAVRRVVGVQPLVSVTRKQMILAPDVRSWEKLV